MNGLSRNLRYWIPALVWLAVIVVESLWLSSSVTGGWLWYTTLHVFHIRMSPITFDRLHHLLRKGGHVAGYGLLCVLLFRSWHHTFSSAAAKHLRLRCAGLALGLTLLTAMLDEWHQSFDPARTGSIRDVALDVTGGIIFLAIALFVFKLWGTATTERLGTASA